MKSRFHGEGNIDVKDWFRDLGFSGAPQFRVVLGFRVPALNPKPFKFQTTQPQRLMGPCANPLEDHFYPFRVARTEMGLPKTGPKP